MPSKLSALTELAAAPATGDELYIRDISEVAADESKRITIANLFGYNILDDALFRLGADGDIALVLNSAGLAANTELTNVIVGTSVYANAIPANSLIVSNITADGDIVFFTNTGGNSIEAMRIDASTRSLVLPQKGGNHG